MGNIAKFGKKHFVFLAAAVMAMASMPSASAMAGTPYGCVDTLQISVHDQGKDVAVKALLSDGAYTNIVSSQTDPFLYKVNSEAAAIIRDIKDRAGAIKISEVDDSIVLDAEALIVTPDMK